MMEKFSKTTSEFLVKHANFQCDEIRVGNKRGGWFITCLEYAMMQTAPTDALNQTPQGKVLRR